MQIDYILIKIEKELIDSIFSLNEEKWQESKNKNYWLRIDAPTDHTQQRHVHIAQKKHLSTKNKQVAWNIDGSRHDKKSFNTKIAKDALGLVDDLILKSLGESNFKELLESYQKYEFNPIKLIVTS